MDQCLLPKRVFVLRLLEFRHNCVETQNGFVPDIIRILKKIRLVYLPVGISESLGLFSKQKIIWTKIVKLCYHGRSREAMVLKRIRNDDDFEMFSLIHKHIAPDAAWKLARQFPELYKAAKCVVDLCSLIRYGATLLLCGNADFSSAI